MALHKNRKGLSLPITGVPKQEIEDASVPSRVAVIATDYVGMRPTMHVNVGDAVRRGQLLFEDKKTPGVRYTSPAAGKVAGVHRGDRRALQSVVIDLDDSERSGRGDSVSFSDAGRHPAEMDGERIRGLLVESGMWTALRARPFGKVADPASQAAAIFVTAVDSNPLGPDVGRILQGREDKFEAGITALTKLTDGRVFVCTGPNGGAPEVRHERVSTERFSGPHPSGTVGFHIHTLLPASRERVVWYLGAQDVVALGHFLTTGELDPGRVVALGGPEVNRPRLLRTRLGVHLDDLVKGEVTEGKELRVLSGSVFAGRAAMGPIHGYLGRYDQQIVALEEGRQREFLGWLAPGANKFSVLPSFVSKLMPGKTFDFTTSTEGSHRAIIPVGVHEKVFPFDIPPTYLIRAIVMQDVEKAEELGVLELAEEDLGLLSFVCPGKYEYGSHLRELLTTIEKEG